MADLSVFYKDSTPTGEYKVRTLCYLQRVKAGKKEFLLGKHFKQGKWNGFGGKVGDKPEFKNETIEQSLKREGLEEFGIEVISPQKRGIMLFDFIDEKGQENKVLCHLFFADKWKGKIRGSSEMLTPTWFNPETIPWNEMWPNDKIWLEEVLKRDEFLEAEFNFASGDGFVASKIKMDWKPLSSI